MLDRSELPAHPSEPGSTTSWSFAERRIREAIQWCELGPGDSVSEPEIAERFGLGRAAVRIAMARLSAEGLAISAPRQGWRIKPITGETLGDLLTARRQIEPLMAQAALGAPELSRIAGLAILADMLRQRGEAQSLTTARHYDGEIARILARGLGAHASGWLDALRGETERVVRFLEGRRPGSSYRGSDRVPLIEAFNQGDRARALAWFGQEHDAFGRFVTDHLLAARIDLNQAPARRRTRKAGSTSPHRPRPGAQPEQGQ